MKVRKMNPHVDDSYFDKGHIHEEELLEPEVCPECNGYGYLVYSGDHEDCPLCGTEGVIYD